VEEYWSWQTAETLPWLDINRVDTLNRLLDKCRLGTGESEGAEAVAGVQILQHVQEELVEQLVLLGRDIEGLGLVILSLDAVCGVVLKHMISCMISINFYIIYDITHETYFRLYMISSLLSCMISNRTR
jgi:hypothetical protein